VIDAVRAAQAWAEERDDITARDLECFAHGYSRAMQAALDEIHEHATDLAARRLASPITRGYVDDLVAWFERGGK
jgi:hypothetical protein